MRVLIRGFGFWQVKTMDTAVPMSVHHTNSWTVRLGTRL